jgi:D-alanyl-D-alanine carboxypeptidase
MKSVWEQHLKELIGGNSGLAVKCRDCLFGSEMINGCPEHNFASRTGDQVGNWDGDFMLRKNLASSRLVRVGVFGLVAIAAVVTSGGAEARHHHHRHYTHHTSHEERDSYSPAFSSIIVDGNSGTTLTATNPDAIRHPASLAKMMTLYLLFERLDSGKMKLDTEMPVSERASDQDPTKLDLRSGQTIKVEDAIKGLVTRSANDAAVVIAEAIGGSEDNFARMMTRTAHELGMSRTLYRNASGLPNDEQVTTARDQSILGRALQDRFPRYYRYFSTTAFNFRGRTIRGHNHLLGNVEGVDGIKTGYTRASGFNLVTSMRRGNRHLVGVVMGGRSGSSRDATMRNLLAENLEKAATRRTVAAIAERNTSDTNADVAGAEGGSAPAQTVQPHGTLEFASADAAAAAPAGKPRVDPAPLTSGVIQTQSITSILLGSTEPMKPVKVKTVQVKAGPLKLAAAGAPQPSLVPANTSAVQPARAEVVESASMTVAKAETGNAGGAGPGQQPEAIRPEMARSELPPQPANHGTGNGILGVLPASSLPASSVNQAMAYVDPASRAQPQAVPDNGAVKSAATHNGWIVQVGALESEGEAQQRIDAARNQAHGLLSKADSFTEPVIAKGDRKLYRARFAGLEHDQADAVCKALKRAEISCMTVRN